MISTTRAVCPHSGRPDDAEPFQVVSRHGTAGGRTVWTRCGCGSLQVRVVDGGGTRIVSRSRPAVGQSGWGAFREQRRPPARQTGLSNRVQGLVQA